MEAATSTCSDSSPAYPIAAHAHRARIGEGERSGTVTFDLWAVIYRVLKRRYKLALLLTVPALVAGAAIGWRCGKHLYRAEGLVRIAWALPQVMHETDQNRAMPMFEGFIQAQRQLMSSPGTIKMAMEEPAWREQLRAGRARSAEQFASGLKVESQHRSDFLRVSFVDPDPAVAAAAVRSVIAAYEKAYLREQDDFERQRMGVLLQRHADLDAQLRQCEVMIVALKSEYGAAELEPAYDAATQRLRNIKLAIADVHRSLAAVTALSIESKAPLQEWQRSTPALTKAGDAARGMRLLGTSHPFVQRLEAEEANLRRLAEMTGEEMGRLGARRARLRQLENQAAAVRAELAQVTRRQDVLTTEASMGGRLMVAMRGDAPVIALLSNRHKAAGAGMLAGTAGPMMLLVLLELLRRRYHYCDEVAEDFAERGPVVAVLPEVNDGGALAAAAAHTVHQLRAHLQPHGDAGSRVYMVTSPARADGKSSVAVSLALSFAAAGYRTLLIDGDFGSRGLSRAMEVDDSGGLREAAAQAQPLIWPTRAGLSFMSAGRSGDSHLAMLPPALMEKVLPELRTRFNVIVIDGGPILTSVDAAVMAPYADGVILSFARGRERALVSKAMRQIDSLAATCAAMVFDRAEESDFRTAMHYLLEDEQLEERTIPERLHRFGPLVAAVLPSVHLSREDDLDIAPAKPVTARRAEPAETADAEGVPGISQPQAA